MCCTTSFKILKIALEFQCIGMIIVKTKIPLGCDLYENLDKKTYMVNSSRVQVP